MKEISAKFINIHLTVLRHNGEWGERKKEDEERGIEVRGTTITTEREWAKNIILWKFQKMAARPSARGKLEQVKALGNEQG